MRRCSNEAVTRIGFEASIACFRTPLVDGSPYAAFVSSYRPQFPAQPSWLHMPLSPLPCVRVHAQALCAGYLCMGGGLRLYAQQSYACFPCSIRLQHAQRASRAVHARVHANAGRVAT